MPVAKPQDFVETYRLKAQLPDLHELAGRGTMRESTVFVARRIAEALDPAATDTVVDVGCGDGALLTLLSPKIGRGIGLSASEEEAGRLRAAHSGYANLAFSQSLATAIRLDGASAERVVCNNMLHVLPNAAAVSSAIGELARIAKPGALVFVGELPFLDEQRSLKQGPSLISRIFGELVYHLKDLRRAGIADLARRTGQYMMARLRKDQLFVIHPKKTICVTPEQLKGFASDAGLELIFERCHVTLDHAGNAAESASRMDYLFRKRSQG